jgi:hypothetical protein
MSDLNVGERSGPGCRSPSHYKDRWAIYDSLPREVRDQLKIARDNLCVGCVRNMLRREGLTTALMRLDRWRRMRREKRGREIWYVPEEDLKP